MANHFPIFMAVMDVAWFRPDLIDPASPVPSGIGAAPFLDRLQRQLGAVDHKHVMQRMVELQSERWPEAKRRLQPIDVEYLCCECRKYYSYVNGTKHFEGKNVFEPGKSATLSFDIQEPATCTTTPPSTSPIFVIAGAPCSGKSTPIQALKRAGHTIEPETAEQLLKAGIES